MHCYRNSQKGYSLVELMIVLLLVGLTTAGISSLLSYALKFSKSIEAKVEFNSLVQTLELILKDEKLCASSLYDSRTDPKMTRPIFNPDLKKVDARDLFSIVQVNQNIITAQGSLHNGFTISVLSLSEMDASQRMILSDTKKQYLAILRIEGIKTVKMLNPRPFGHDFILWITTESDRIASCKMQSQDRMVTNCKSTEYLQNVDYVKGTFTCATMPTGTATKTSGGSYVFRNTYGGYLTGCMVTNPYTGGCSCPAGYTSVFTGSGAEWGVENYKCI